MHYFSIAEMSLKATKTILSFGDMIAVKIKGENIYNIYQTIWKFIMVFVTAYFCTERAAVTIRRHMIYMKIRFRVHIKMYTSFIVIIQNTS